MYDEERAFFLLKVLVLVGEERENQQMHVNFDISYFIAHQESHHPISGPTALMFESAFGWLLGRLGR